MTTTTDSADLVSRTQQLVLNAPRTIKLKHMAEAVGCSIAWISRFANNKIADPGANTVQRLHDYLVKQNGQ